MPNKTKRRYEHSTLSYLISVDTTCHTVYPSHFTLDIHLLCQSTSSSNYISFSFRSDTGRNTTYTLVQSGHCVRAKNNFIPSLHHTKLSSHFGNKILKQIIDQASSQTVSVQKKAFSYSYVMPGAFNSFKKRRLNQIAGDLLDLRGILADMCGR